MSSRGSCGRQSPAERRASLGLSWGSYGAATVSISARLRYVVPLPCRHVYNIGLPPVTATVAPDT